MTKDIVKTKATEDQGGDHDKPDAEQRGPGMPPTSEAFHTFVGLDTKLDEKVIRCTVNAYSDLAFFKYGQDPRVLC